MTGPKSPPSDGRAEESVDGSHGEDDQLENVVALLWVAFVVGTERTAGLFLSFVLALATGRAR